jgi:hypothetical protein
MPHEGDRFARVHFVRASTPSRLSELTWSLARSSALTSPTPAMRLLCCQPTCPRALKTLVPVSSLPWARRWSPSRMCWWEAGPCSRACTTPTRSLHAVRSVVRGGVDPAAVGRVVDVELRTRRGGKCEGSREERTRGRTRQLNHTEEEPGHEDVRGAIGEPVEHCVHPRASVSSREHKVRACGRQRRRPSTTRGHPGGERREGQQES